MNKLICDRCGFVVEEEGKIFPHHPKMIPYTIRNLDKHTIEYKNICLTCDKKITDFINKKVN